MKKAIVIGASSGIGEQLAQLLRQDGWTTILTGRREELLKKISGEYPDAFNYSVFDVKETAKVEEKLTELADQSGGCDLLIISAGTGDINEQLLFDIEKDIIDTNVSGFTCVADWAYRYFQEQGHGHLAAITSVAGIRGYRGAPAYNATKAYQLSDLEALRQKSNKSKLPIIVTDIRPGFVNTKMAKGEGLFWVASPEKAAKQIMSAIRRKRKVVYITKRWRLIATVLRIVPRFIYERL
ncbi:MAG: SDR family NAD(P)-dependent oxidoreductase [Ferruginibacter sp.]